MYQRALFIDHFTEVTLFIDSKESTLQKQLCVVTFNSTHVFRLFYAH